jgi:predicted peptidase
MIAIRLLVLAAAAVVWLSAAPLRARAADERGFLDKVYKDPDGKEYKYVLFVPHNYDAKTACPIILFLHGAGETKGGQKQPVEVGIGPAIKKREKTFPFLVVIPQSENRTWQANSADGKRALAILEDVEKQYNVDKQREYLTGLSMGGFGTWSLAFQDPQRWTAIVPICGGLRGDPGQVIKLKSVPIWCFHGADDPTVNVEQSRRLINALKEAGASPKYTEYPGVKHNSWDKAYNTDELYDWLLKQIKK